MKKKLVKKDINIDYINVWLEFYGEGNGDFCGLSCGLEW
jgi:hypothetical protein